MSDCLHTDVVFFANDVNRISCINEPEVNLARYQAAHQTWQSQQGLSRLPMAKRSSAWAIILLHWTTIDVIDYLFLYIFYFNPYPAIQLMMTITAYNMRQTPRKTFPRSEASVKKRHE